METSIERKEKEKGILTYKCRMCYQASYSERTFGGIGTCFKQRGIV